MLRFECDYGEGAAPAVFELLQKTNFDQTPGYGEDEYCAKAAAQIKRLCDAPDADVHFFVGATQANLTVIAAALKPWPRWSRSRAHGCARSRRTARPATA